MAAGLAATGAAFVTSRFGVAGTLLGAAVTAMIITGGSALLRAYIESAAGRVRGGATRLRERRASRPSETVQAAPTQQDSPPGRPDLRNNFAGRIWHINSYLLSRIDDEEFLAQPHKENLHEHHLLSKGMQAELRADTAAALRSYGEYLALPDYVTVHQTVETIFARWRHRQLSRGD